MLSAGIYLSSYPFPSVSLHQHSAVLCCHTLGSGSTLSSPHITVYSFYFYYKAHALTPSHFGRIRPISFAFSPLFLFRFQVISHSHPFAKSFSVSQQFPLLLSVSYSLSLWTCMRAHLRPLSPLFLFSSFNIIKVYLESWIDLFKVYLSLSSYINNR